MVYKRFKQVILHKNINVDSIGSFDKGAVLLLFGKIRQGLLCFHVKSSYTGNLRIQLLYK